MIKHKILTVLLLISMSLSTLNGFFIDLNEKDSCSISEYVSEFSQTNDCGDLCDVRHMFYISFILPTHSHITKVDNCATTPIHTQDYWTSKYTFPIFHPPINA